MAIFRRKLPPRRDIVLVFAACIFPVYSWSIFWFLRKMPGWLQFLNFWDIVSIFAYTQAFALLESALVLFLLIVLCIVLPARFFRNKFAAQGSMVVFMTALWAAVFQSVSGEICLWSLGEFLFWSALALTTTGVLCLLIYRSKRIERAIRAFAGRLAVLLYVYVPSSCLSLIIVIARNV